MNSVRASGWRLRIASLYSGASVNPVLAAFQLLSSPPFPRGPARVRKTKIICTIGPNTCSYEKLERLYRAGMNVVRLNMSHGDHAWHALIEVVADRAGADRLGELCEAMMTGAFECDLVDDATFAANETQAEAFWLLRESIAPAERARGPAVQHDISVPVERMPEFVDVAVPTIEASWPGTHAVVTDRDVPPRPTPNKSVCLRGHSLLHVIRHAGASYCAGCATTLGHSLLQFC